MSLGKRQEEFASMLTHLLVEAHSLGYQVRIGHALRCNDCKIGHMNSLHKMKLAIDLLLFRDGKYLKNTEDYKELGEYWESIGGSWGGRFHDGNHFSLSYQGMK